MPNVDLSSTLRPRSGDFSNRQIAKLTDSEDALNSLAKVVSEHASNGEPSIAFCASVRTAIGLCDTLRESFGIAAAMVSGKTDRQERREIIARYASGEIQVIANVGVLTEGFDAPNTSRVFLFRPTKSLGLLTQMVGRGLRPLPGIIDGLDSILDRKAAIAESAKPRCKIVDLGAHHKLKLATPVDLLDPVS